MNRALLLSLLACAAVRADGDTVATYLANQGVLVESGDTAVLFDPLFDRDFGQFQLVPEEMQAALMAGEEPFDDVAAVFVSHYHGDHFSPALMLEYLRRQPSVRLYAPMQATNALREAAGDDHDVMTQVTGLALEHGDAPVTMQLGELSVSAIRLPHSGWPDRMTDIENLAFRVTLDEQIIVEHYGDADPNRQHFEVYPDYWTSSSPDFAMPPYWFFLSPEGRDIVADIIRPDQVVGTHAPVELPPYPATRAPEFQAFDVFRKPGERRDIPSAE